MAIVLGKYSSFHTNAPLDASISRLTRVLHLHKGKKGKNILLNTLIAEEFVILS